MELQRYCLYTPPSLPPSLTLVFRRLLRSIVQLHDIAFSFQSTSSDDHRSTKIRTSLQMSHFLLNYRICNLQFTIYNLQFTIYNLQFTGEENFKSSMPDTAVIVQPTIFDKNEMLVAKRKKIKVKGYAASKAGMTCDQVLLVSCIACLLFLRCYLANDLAFLQISVCCISSHWSHLHPYRYPSGVRC